jgi:hypothetical protein
MDVTAALAARLVGRSLSAVYRREYDWAFGFGDATSSGLRVSCPWRILFENRIAFTDSDHGQKFGLPEPLDGEKEVQRLLGNKAIERISIRPDTGDLSITFSNQAVLEVLNMSSGYEGWEIGANGLSVIATGGGELAIFAENSKL